MDTANWLMLLAAVYIKAGVCLYLCLLTWPVWRRRPGRVALLAMVWPLSSLLWIAIIMGDLKRANTEPPDRLPP